MTKKTLTSANNEEVEMVMPTLEKLFAENNKLRQQLLEIESQAVQLKVEEAIEEDSDVDIRPDKYIKVMSLCPHPLNLSTGRERGHKTVRFARFGEVKRILYKDLVDIIENHPTFTEEGLYYILNKDVIRRHGLDDAYAKILTKEKIELVFSENNDTSIALFKSANPRQKSTITDMIIAKYREDEESVDKNIIHIVSKDTGIDIITLAEEGKVFLEQTQKK